MWIKSCLNTRSTDSTTLGVSGDFGVFKIVHLCLIACFFKICHSNPILPSMSPGKPAVKIYEITNWPWHSVLVRHLGFMRCDVDTGDVNTDCLSLFVGSFDNIDASTCFGDDVIIDVSLLLHTDGDVPRWCCCCCHCTDDITVDDRWSPHCQQCHFHWNWKIFAFSIIALLLLFAVIINNNHNVTPQFIMYTIKYPVERPVHGSEVVADIMRRWAQWPKDICRRCYLAIRPGSLYDDIFSKQAVSLWIFPSFAFIAVDILVECKLCWNSFHTTVLAICGRTKNALMLLDVGSLLESLAARLIKTWCVVWLTKIFLSYWLKRRGKVVRKVSKRSLLKHRSEIIMLF